ncbi:MAG: type II toxin-antitoxin system Phd/YefM family antitoxin [Rhodospirillales bacterium]|nr:type II toxin-antitoxin system Phd/YefM family antitoxin [Rhodospirillales bacterium]
MGAKTGNKGKAGARRPRGGKAARKAPPRLSAGCAGFGALRPWKLEDAKARFSEVVRRARAEGPQRVTYRGEDAVVVIAVDELARLLPAGRPRKPLVDFLQATALGEIDVGRAPDRGRDLDL